MGLFGALKSVGSAACDLVDKAIPDPGDIAENICDKLLPKELEFVGDLVSFGVNAYSGNWAAAACDIGDFATSEFSALEPTPPPRYSQEQIDAERRVTQGPGAFGADAPPPAPGPAGGAPPAQPANAPAAASGTPASAGSATQGSDAKKGVQAAKDFIASFSDPEDLLRAVRNGDIPEHIADSEAGMQILQMKVQHMARMNQLMTQMLQTMHEMQMAIVRNIRA